MPASEVAQGWVALTLVVVATALLAFRPYIEVREDGLVTLQGPFVRRRFHRVDVVEMGPTGWGLRFMLRDNSRALSIVCQDTASRNEPRWFDVAEVVTGRRPSIEESGQEDEE